MSNLTQVICSVADESVNEPIGQGPQTMHLLQMTGRVNGGCNVCEYRHGGVGLHRRLELKKVNGVSVSGWSTK